MQKLWGGLAFAVSLLVSAVACGGTLEQVQQRGALNCGVGTGLAGFSLPDSKGQWTGLDVDYCKAIAAAVLRDASKVHFIPLSAKDRFTALQSGEIDLLIRNSTWTLSREADLGLLFGGVNFYDGQGFMIRKKLNISNAKGLNGASICVQQGTTTELNLADFFRTQGLKYESVVFATSDETRQAYDIGRCDAYTTDASSLYGERLKLANPQDHLVLPDILSKEPFAPVVRKGDDKWFDIVRWVHYALVNAEELGITQANAEEKQKSTDPQTRRLLGIEGELGKGLGLSKDWALISVKAVGNYGEIFERNVGEKTPLKIQRGVNALWNKGGLMYAPPIR